MYFDTFADFIAMGTHGPYVWSSYGLTGFIILLNLLAVVRRRKQVITTIRQKLRRQQHQEDTET